jgi:hypothetical protein
MAKPDEEQLLRLKAALHEYATIDDRVPEKVLLRIIRDAIVQPTSELPLVLQQHVPGTEMHRLSRIPSNQLTETEAALLETVDDFRTRHEAPVTVQPRLGQRVRRTAPHRAFPIGMLGTIDVVHENGQDFWVMTDEGGCNGWTSFASWQPEPEGT